MGNTLLRDRRCILRLGFAERDWNLKGIVFLGRDRELGR